MGGSKSKSSGKSEIRYAPYIETIHRRFLDRVDDFAEILVDESPYEDYEQISVDSGFFGIGYTLASFPSLYDMFGKFMAGLDIGVLANQMLEDTVNSSTISDLVKAETELLDDTVSTKILPKFQTGMRDINSVMTSSYIVGKAIIADSQTKAIEKFSSELKYRMIPVAAEKWKAHLEWNHSMITTYSQLIKLYTAAKLDTSEYNLRLGVNNTLWPFTVLEYERAALGALQGATNTGGADTGGGEVAGALGGALSGAAAGSVMGPWGAVAGGAIGLAASFL